MRTVKGERSASASSWTESVRDERLERELDEDLRDTEGDASFEFLYDSRWVSQSPTSSGESGGESWENSDIKIRGGMGNGSGDAGADCVGADGTSSALVPDDAVSMRTFRLSQDGDGGMKDVLVDAANKSASQEYGEAVS